MIFNTKVNVVKLLNSKGNITVLFDKKAKCKLLSGKTKQFRHIQETSPLKNGFVLETVEKVQIPLNLKGLKLSQGLIIPDIDNLQKELDKLFRETWDLKSKKAEDLDCLSKIANSDNGFPFSIHLCIRSIIFSASSLMVEKSNFLQW